MLAPLQGGVGGGSVHGKRGRLDAPVGSTRPNAPNGERNLLHQLFGETPNRATGTVALPFSNRIGIVRSGYVRPGLKQPHWRRSATMSAAVLRLMAVLAVLVPVIWCTAS